MLVVFGHGSLSLSAIRRLAVQSEHWQVRRAVLDLLMDGGLNSLVIGEDQWEAIEQRRQRREADEQAMAERLKAWCEPKKEVKEMPGRYRRGDYWTLLFRPPQYQMKRRPLTDRPFNMTGQRTKSVTRRRRQRASWRG
jgi:hypothetical protein